MNDNKLRVRKFRKTLKGKFNGWKNSAIRRNIKWNISLEDLKNLPLICYYTGKGLTLKTKQENSISLDRLDSSKPYQKDNVVFCCEIINRMKWELAESEFIKICKNILEAQNKSIKNPVKYEPKNFKTYRKLSARMVNRRCSANKKKREFSLSIDEISQRPFNCYYTHIPLTCEPNHPNTVSFDRLDSNLGYTPENTVLCCHYVNLMKQEMSESEFLKNCKLIVENKKTASN